LEPRKGLDVAIAALARPGAPALPLLVAGQPGWGGLDLPGAAAARGLAPDRLRLLGRLDDADLAVLLSRAIAVVLPSRAEGFGLPLLEAMSLGTPTVIADAPALVEVAGGAALVVPREDAAALAAALGRLAADASRRGGLAAAGRRRAAAYSWHDAARRLWTAYAELLAP
jgi:glycosyltransferase involved in cell wall biosynthesis